MRSIARPTKNQRVMYNGHKRVHAIKVQCVVTPNSLVANLSGQLWISLGHQTLLPLLCLGTQAWPPLSNVKTKKLIKATSKNQRRDRLASTRGSNA